MKITIGHLYPDLLNLYGDRGNIQSLKKRCEWRGIEAEVKEYSLKDEIDFSEVDVLLLGGGGDREQSLVCEHLKSIKEELKKYVEDGGVMLAVCGGYEMLGNYYETAEGRIEGLGLIDMYTEHQEPRLISNVILENELFGYPVTGFENHAGRTVIGKNPAFGKVLFGNGNDGKSGSEGVRYKNVIGTYLHGPLLPKNPHVADHLLLKALEKKYGVRELEALDDTQEKAANQYIVERFLKAEKK